MKYKKWWLPAIFTVISSVWLICAIMIFPSFAPSDSGYGALGIGIGGLASWFFLALPVASFIYSRKVLEDGKDRFPMTLYNSFLLTLPTTVYYGIVLWTLNTMDLFCLVAFIWCEMWALVGLSGKGKYKKVAVWYVPVFLFIAAIALELCINYLLKMLVPQYYYAVSLVLEYVVIPISMFFYARACVKPRNKRAAFTVGTAFLLSIVPFSSMMISAIGGRLVLDSAWDTVALVLIYAATFALYEIVALLGAGYKIRIKLPKRKKKAEKQNNEIDTTETKEDD